MPKTDILCVCSSGMTRAPLMEHVLKELLREKGISGVGVGSAGVIESTAGQSMDALTQATLLERGWQPGQLCGFKSRFIGSIDTAQAKHIIFADRLTLAQAAPYIGRAAHQVVLNGDAGVSNPKFLELPGYQACADLIEERLRAFVDECLADGQIAA